MTKANKKFLQIIDIAQHIPEVNVAEYYVNRIIVPLIALADVHVFNLKPHEEFFKLYQDAKKNGDILIINTMKPQEMIEIELSEYALLDSEKYGIFLDILKCNLVFGSTKESCKLDSNRIEFIMRHISNKYEEMVIMGDSGTDISNFEEAVKKMPSSSLTFLFISNKFDKRIEEQSMVISSLKDDYEKLKESSAILEKTKMQLLMLVERMEKIKINNPSININRGNYRDMSHTIYN